MGVNLRPYQVECINTIAAQEPGAYLINMATGLGKTVTFANIPRQGRMLILSHREELVNQPRKYFNCTYGIEMASQRSHGEEVVSASVMSLVRRLDRFKPTDFDVIIVDECHHSVTPTYRKILNYFKPRLVLGFTATPNRADKQALGEVFHKIIFDRDLKWGIDHGYLSPIKALRVDLKLDLDAIKQINGDFDPKLLAKAVNTPSRNKAIADAYNTMAVGQTIIFAASVAHAQALSNLIPGSRVVTGETPNRANIIKEFTERKFRCLINCMVFTEGTDMPLIETVMICRPTCNHSLYAQMVGRGLRLSEGKKETVVIDCMGVSKRCNLITVPHLFNVEMEGGYLPDGDPNDEPEEEKEEKVLILPVFNSSFVDVQLTNTIEDNPEEYRDYAWFFTCKERRTGQVVTKILYTEDIDSAVYNVRKAGYTFVTLVSYKSAVKLATGTTKRVKMIYDNLTCMGGINEEGIKVPEFFKALLAIEEDGKVNDNLTWDLIKEYITRKPEINNTTVQEAA